VSTNAEQCESQIRNELTRKISINFNIVSKGLGSQRMSHYLNEAATDLRELMSQTLEAPKAKL
jgi:hypothetical protein